MKTSELLESDPLADLDKVLPFRATKSHVSMEGAQAVHDWLKGKGYRWKFEEFKGGASAIHIIGSSYKKSSWRDAPGMKERRDIRTMLHSHGFVTAPFRGHALSQEPSSYNGPHIYFW